MVDGLPEAVHGTDSVGWLSKGVPVKAELLEKPEHGHPLWCVSESDFPTEDGYSHFHWINGPPLAVRLKKGNDLVVAAGFIPAHNGCWKPTKP